MIEVRSTRVRYDAMPLHGWIESCQHCLSIWFVGMPLPLFYAEILASKWETRSTEVVYIPTMASYLTIVLLTYIVCSSLPSLPRPILIPMLPNITLLTHFLGALFSPGFVSGLKSGFIMSKLRYTAFRLAIQLKKTIFLNFWSLTATTYFFSISDELLHNLNETSRRHNE